MEERDLRQTLSGLLGPAGPEVGCDTCFDEVDRFVELELAEEDADAANPGCAPTSPAAPHVARSTRGLLALASERP